MSVLIKIYSFLLPLLGEKRMQSVLLRMFGCWMVPMIGYLRPRVVKADGQTCEIMIPLGFRARNHLRSMYFGALAVGADCAGGFAAFQIMLQEKKVMSFAFKDVKGEFLKRAEGDVFFRCTDVAAIRRAFEDSKRTKERINIPVHIDAFVPEKLGTEAVAKFILTLSLKVA